MDIIGWGEHANGRLLDDVLDGRDALIGYARDIEQLRMPTTDDLLALLAEAEDELRNVDSDSSRLEVEDAATAIRQQLTATTPAVPVAAREEPCMPDTLWAVIRRHPGHTDGHGAFESGFEAERECDRLAADGIPAAELEIVPIPVRVGLAVAS